MIDYMPFSHELTIFSLPLTICLIDSCDQSWGILCSFRIFAKDLFSTCQTIYN